MADSLNVNTLLDADRLGKMLLIAVEPTYTYSETGQRTNNVDGYKYTVLLPQLGFSKLSVKIAGEQRLDVPVGTMVPVYFDGLELKVYSLETSRSVYLSAKAGDIVQSED